MTIYMKKTLFVLFFVLIIKPFVGKSQVSTTLSHEKYRPRFHYTPPQNWVNDPNGLVYLDGEYHLFYQYNPFGSDWGHMSWGHAVSNDLKHWTTLPVALQEFENTDGSKSMIFSGCVVVDSLNTSGFFSKGFKKGMVAIFTTHIEKNGKGILQTQSLAYSADKGRTWTMFHENPVLDIGLSDFRDPNVIWYPQKKKWIMTVVKSLEYTVQLYESADLKHWTLLSEFAKQGDVSKIWECPSLFQVPIEGTTQQKWVLMISSGHRQPNYLGMQYFVGDFDGKQFIPQKQDSVFYVDEGKDFYAAIPYANLPQGQHPIMIGWLNDWVYAGKIPTEKWRGGFSIPRKLSLLNDKGTFKLRQKPLISSEIPTNHVSLKANQAFSSKLAKINKNVYRLVLTIDLKHTKGFDLFLLKNKEEYSKISYDVLSETLSFDRTKSGHVNFSEQFASIEKMQVKQVNNVLTLDIIVDKSSVEIFANNGANVLTDLVFPRNETSSFQIKWKK